LRIFCKTHAQKVAVAQARGRDGGRKKPPECSGLFFYFLLPSELMSSGDRGRDHPNRESVPSDCHPRPTAVAVLPAIRGLPVIGAASARLASFIAVIARGPSVQSMIGVIQPFWQPIAFAAGDPAKAPYPCQRWPFKQRFPNCPN